LPRPELPCHNGRTRGRFRDRPTGGRSSGQPHLPVRAMSNGHALGVLRDDGSQWVVPAKSLREGPATRCGNVIRARAPCCRTRPGIEGPCQPVVVRLPRLQAARPTTKVHLVACRTSGLGRLFVRRRRRAKRSGT
jgi:hypothetical protein